MTRLPLAAAFAALTALPAAALDLEAMTEGEREAFRAEVRSFLLENPEVILEAINVLEERQAAAQAAGDSELVETNAEALFEDGHSWVGGNPEGDVTVVEFLDYRCGYCKRAHPEVSELIASDGNIRYIVKEFPILGEQSVMASRFAIAVQRLAGDDAYSEMHDALMTMRGQVNEAALRSMATEQGLDADALFTEMQNPAVDQIIAENRALAQRLQINGTPSFVFQDQMVRGYVPLDAMREIVEEVRTEG
jgi:protein-disulfide isomerase